MEAHLRATGAGACVLARWTTYGAADGAFYAEGAKWSGIHHHRSCPRRRPAAPAAAATARLRAGNGETLVYRKPTGAPGDVGEFPPDRNVDEDRVALRPPARTRATA